MTDEQQPAPTDLTPKAQDFIDRVRATAAATVPARRIRLRVLTLPAQPDGSTPFLIVFDRCTAEQQHNLNSSVPAIRAATGAALVLVAAEDIDLDNAEVDEATARRLMGPNVDIPGPLAEPDSEATNSERTA